ncbi:endo alpha-1,4 polygalactosaminidase [Plantibacter sp. VKM Ac-2880]|uniref:endo alpha-1,4 polygalactosaminidase n=1 Tax=Plantibacter sp. VKM Ac-2880 TaxID=2783827 RepID=UPI0018905175|nr:endo alpha-1,4 polygalactosaminidase [Plantibacter sp. VKM Ac-2880]MBF4569927.1 endo alpha-1,4 polygalactosaminidase [Plantibacter sp. VKM Ac-2880]
MPFPHLRARKALAAAGVLAVALVAAGCSSSQSEAASSTGSATAASGFPTDIVFDYQLGGGYEPAAGVGGVVRDSTDTPAPDRYSICYVNGFQSQPADRDAWLAEPDLVLTDEAGEPIIDENWPDELIFDLSTDDRRARIAERVGTSITRCADAGFDAVEIDNLDSYTRSDGRLTVDDAMALATRYADLAHDAGLLIGQKNAGDLGTRGRDDVGFDFAVAEECHRFDECGTYTEVYGGAVLDIEYTDDLRGTFDEVCADPQVPFSTILRDRDLAPADAADHVYEACR